MADEKLESFKIGDSHRPGMSAPASKGGKPADEAITSSLGFARIEELLEKEPPEQVGQSLNEIMSKLEELRDSADSNKVKAGATKALAAVERTVDLMDYLYQTKQQLEDNQS